MASTPLVSTATRMTLATYTPLASVKAGTAPMQLEDLAILHGRREDEIEDYFRRLYISQLGYYLQRHDDIECEKTVADDMHRREHANIDKAEQLLSKEERSASYVAVTARGVSDGAFVQRTAASKIEMAELPRKAASTLKVISAIDRVDADVRALDLIIYLTEANEANQAVGPIGVPLMPLYASFDFHGVVKTLCGLGRYSAIVFMTARTRGWKLSDLMVEDCKCGHLERAMRILEDRWDEAQ